MKNRIILILAVSSLLLWGCDDAFYNFWEPAAGDDEVGRVIAPASDGGYLIAGQKYYADSESDEADLYLVFLSESGHSEWETIYSTDMHSEPLAARETSDRGFLILAQRSVSAELQGVFVLKLDVDGHVQWAQTVAIGNLNRVVDAEVTDDGGFAILGVSGSLDHVTLIKTDAGGGVMFVRTYGDDNVPVDVEELAGGFVLLSNVDRNADSSTVELIRTDPWGQSQWSSRIWSYGLWVGWHVAEDSDGGFLIVGETNSGSPSSTPHLIKADLRGNWLWRENYPESSGATINAVVSGWNGTLLAGDMSYGSDSDYDGFALHANRDGDWLWWHSFGGSDTDWILDAIPGNSGGYVLAGGSSSFSDGGDADIYVLKIDSNGGAIWETTVGE